MVTSTRQEEIIEHCLRLCPELIKLSKPHLWVDYDHEADVLYISFRQPQNATHTIEVDENVLVRLNGDNLVGVTIMNAATLPTSYEYA